MKAGSKRRRTKEDLESSQRQEELKDDQNEHLRFQFDQLTRELEKTKAESASNKAAAEILTQMIESGEAVKQADGSVSVSKHKSK